MKLPWNHTRIASLFGLGFALLPGALPAGNSESNRQPPAAIAQSPAAELGIASYYHDKYHGRRTASGEVFDTHQLTAAHRSLRFGTRVKVTHLASGRTVTVRINDRGPFVAGRVIDLSRAAARELQMERAGLAQVKVEILPAKVASR